MISSTIDTQKSSGDQISTKPVEEKVKSDEISPVASNIPTSVESKDSKTQDSSKASKKTKKPKAKKSSTDKKSGVFSTLINNNKQKPKVPALDLPPVQHNLNITTQSNSLQSYNIDPLHVPSNDLPKLDIPLPTYNRPEVDITVGQVKQTSEFAVPALNLTPLSDIQTPDNKKQSIEINLDQIRAPTVQLPDLQFTFDKQIQEKTVVVSTIEDASTVKTTCIVKTETYIPKLSSDESQTSIKPKLTSIEQTTTVIETKLNQSSDIPVVLEVNIHLK